MIECPVCGSDLINIEPVLSMEDGEHLANVYVCGICGYVEVDNID